MEAIPKPVLRLDSEGAQIIKLLFIKLSIYSIIKLLFFKKVRVLTETRTRASQLTGLGLSPLSSSTVTPGKAERSNVSWTAYLHAGKMERNLFPSRL